MAQFKKTKKGPLMSVTIPKLDTKQAKKPNELSVRVGAISRAIPPQVGGAKKKESTQSDMLHSLNTPKSKKYGVSSSITPQFIDSHKPVEAKPPLVKSKHSMPNTNSGVHVKTSFPEQTASFKTKAEKKSMSLEKLDERIGEDSFGSTYWYNGSKKIFKLGVGQQERELVSNGHKECLKLIKSLSQSSKNQDLITKLQESILPQIKLSKTKKHRDNPEWNSPDTKHSHEKKSQKILSSSASTTLFHSSLETKHSKYKKSTLAESSFSKSIEEHNQVHSSTKRDSIHSNNKKEVNKPSFMHKQTLVDHKQTPDFSNSPHKLSKPNSNESTQSLTDIKHIDPSNIPVNVSATQRKKKRGRPPGPSDKTKKKLANKPLSIQPNRGRPKKNPILTKLKKYGSPNITSEYSKKMSNPIRVTDEFKKQKADKKVFLEVQVTSANMDNMLKEDSKQRTEVKRKDDKIIVSKTPNPPFITTNPKLKRAPFLSSSSEDDDSESSSSKPPRAKTKHFRSSKSSESDTPDVPKTPGPISTSPRNPWGDMIGDSKIESNKSSKVKLNNSPFKGTDTVTIPSAHSRGKQMPKKHTRPQNENTSPHTQAAKPIEDSYDHHTTSPRTNTHPGKTIASSKLSISVTEQKLPRPKQTETNVLVKQDSLGNQSTAPAVESSEDSSSDSSDSDSSSTSDESDDSPTKVSDVNSLPQPISSQSSTVAKPPTTSGQDHPRVAYVFTTELANKAALAVRRGDVKTIVEFHQRYQAPLAHLKLSTERRHNLENKNKSPGQTAGGIADMSGKKIADKSLTAPDTSSSETSSTSDEDTESSGQDSRPPSPASPALHKPVSVEPISLEEQMDHSDTSSEQQDDLMSPRQMIPKTPGPPPGKNLILSDDESDIEVQTQHPYRGKSQMNLTPGRDTDTSDLQEDMNMVPKTPGAGLVKHLELSEDDEVVDGKDQSDDDKISFDKRPRAPRPPRTPDEDDESQTRDFDNILKGLNSFPMSKSPSVSPLDLQLQARPPATALSNTTPRQSPYQNPLSNHASSSNNPSAKSTPTIAPMGSGSNGSPYVNHLQNTEGYNTNAPTPLDNRPYVFPNLPQGTQFNSHYSSPSRIPHHTMDQIHCSTPSQMPSTLHEAIAAPYRTLDTRRANLNKLPHSELPTDDIGMLPGSARKDSIDSNTGLYPPQQPQQQQQQQQQRFPMNMPYYYQNNQTTYPGISPINMNYNIQQKHPQVLMRPQMEQNPYSQANNVTSPLYIPEHTSLATDMTSHYPTESLPPSIHPAANNGQYYSPNTPAYTRMSTPRHESQAPSEHGYQTTLPSHMNIPLPPTYVNGDPRFNNLTTQMAPPANLLLESESIPLSRTFSEFSTPNLQGTPIDTNIANLNPTLHIVPENTTPHPQLSASISQENFNFSESTQSPVVPTTSPPPSIQKQTTSCSTSPPPQPVKPAPKPPKPLMVDRVMQTDGDDTWDNSKPEMDTILEIEIEAASASKTSSECQTENMTQMEEVKVEPAIWDPSTGQKEKQEGEDVLMIRIPTHLISKETKFLNGKIADDFVNIAELPKLTPLNLKDREKFFQTKVGWADRCADFQRKYYDNPPPLRSLFTSERGIPQLKPIKNIRTNGFTSSAQVDLDFRDLPKLRPIIPLIVTNNS